ncbi:MAG TPA: plasmid recombination protein [Candidatus Onthousia excrementipullorum]|uniref:Plasmid recombination protein n=1 Tax=Candidatus Onthousia excrementipullorum TaxID=2840884 RepID=A0A9D1DT57_9FIRM|nr:plasmid recombination protein [Candidatus Onthousia excrementipullorum]
MSKYTPTKRMVIYMEELAYSLHLGSDKNRKNISRKNGKNNVSGNTSLSNNAIQNARQLSKVDKHNYRKYDNEQELIEIVRGTSSPFEDVKKLYLNEFEEARLEYNSKQTRPSRMIDNYFENISNNEKKDLACEIIIELGDKEYWDTKDEIFKKKMTNVYTKQVDDLELLVPNFKVASAIIHYDETSPHMHIVGVPIKFKNKNGMEKQVGKSDVFTKESLKTLQDKMRTLCIEEFNQEYNLDHSLKQKQKGRNKDIHISDMDNYIQMKKQLEKNNKNLEQSNKKYLELKNSSKEVKDKIDNLKTSKFSKDNYILSKEDKDLFINFINQVETTNKEYDKIQTLSNTLINVDKQLKDNQNKIKTLTENNKALNLRVNTLNDTIREKNKEISKLNSIINDIKSTLNYWKDKFDKLITFLHSKLHIWYDKDDKYIDVVNEMYEDNVLDEEDMKDLDLNKKDDFEK